MARTMFVNLGVTEPAAAAVKRAKLSLTSPETGTVTISETVLAALDIANEDPSRFKQAVLARRADTDR